MAPWSQSASQDMVQQQAFPTDQVSFQQSPMQQQQAFPTDQVSFQQPAQQQAFPADQVAFQQSPVQQPFPQEQGPSLLPVPYQDPAAANQQSLMVMPTNALMQNGAWFPMTTTQAPGPLVPAIPTQEDSVYIPPMYTQPRAIIPRYRAISGFISIIIVLLALCGGTAYYARASGKLSFLKPLFGNVLPTSIPNTTANLPDPAQRQNGPGYGIISSATTASSIDTKTAIALQPTQIFKPGQIIYLTYSVHPKASGTVLIKWYTNNTLYKPVSVPVNLQGKGGSFNGYIDAQFTQALEGRLELYWSDNTTPQPQLAITLYFVVR